MVAEERKNMGLNTIMHNLTLENRNTLKVSGVKDVLSFDDELIVMETELGLLTIKGESLRINKLSIDNGDVAIDGEIYDMCYNDPSKKVQEQGLFSKIFK